MIHHLQQLRIVRRYYTVFGTLIAILFAHSAEAQNVANAQATANVAASLAVTSAQNLQFGAVFQGVAKSIGNNVDASSGIFNIVGAASAGLTMFFTMPDYIALADGSDRMDISFSTTDAVVDTNNTTPSTVVAGDGWVNINPRSFPAGLVVGAAGQTNVYLGGRVTPSITQKAGAYAGSVILSVAYNGT